MAPIVGGGTLDASLRPAGGGVWGNPLQGCVRSYAVAAARARTHDLHLIRREGRSRALARTATAAYWQ